MGNIIRANCGKAKDVTTATLWQFDYGQILMIEGIELPTGYQVHFSNEPYGESTTSIGTANGVEIPDAYLQGGNDVYAWLYLHEGENDGETVLTIRIPVKPRAAITNAEPTPVQQEEIDQLIIAMNMAVDAAEDAEEAAEGSAEDAEAWAVGKRKGEDVGSTDETYHNNSKYWKEKANESATSSAGYAAVAVSAKNSAEAAATAAAGSATSAAGSASAAAASATTAGNAKTAAETAATAAAGSATDAAGSATAAAGSASDAAGSETSAAGSASAAAGSATAAAGSATAAAGSATSAGTAKTAAETAQGLAETAQTAAEAAQALAEAAQDAAETAQGAAETAQEAAEDAQDAAETAAESVSSSAAQIATNAADISDLKSAFDANFTPTNLAKGATFTGYYYVNYTDGTNKAGNSYKASSMIDISGCTKIMYDRLYTANSTSYAGIAFYDENQAFIANSGIPSVFNQSSGEYKLEAADVPTGAKYVRITGFRQLSTVMRVYDYTDYISKIPVLLNNQETAITQINNDIQKTNTRIDNIGLKEPITNVMSFRRGYWNEVNSFKTTTAYRVGCSTPITFSKTVYICALNGFGMCGYRGGVFFSTQGVLTVPANTELKLFIRRVWEDETEIADVDEFTNGIYILNYNPSSEYDLNLDTFAGIEMFRTAGFIGDSYTATRLGYSWVDILQNITGVQSTKFAKSGADSGTWRNAASYGLPALLNDTPKDLYWMALGINDGDRVDSNSSYLGSVADLTGSYADYPDTFWGNTGCIIESIQAFAPNAKIVLFKPIFTSVIRTLAGQSATQNGIKEVRDAIGEIGQHYSLPVMDALDDVLYQSPWFTASLDSAVSAGTHPSLVLFPAIAKANMRLMSRCIQANGDYFRNLRYDT